MYHPYDCRFNQKSRYQQSLSKWIRQRLQFHPTSQSVASSLQQFCQYMMANSSNSKEIFISTEKPTANNTITSSTTSSISHQTPKSDLLNPVKPGGFMFESQNEKQ